MANMMEKMMEIIENQDTKIDALVAQNNLHLNKYSEPNSKKAS